MTLSQIHPVLDARNRPISAPTSFDINTSIQRALVKAIALHGLGLYVYTGEDLPSTDKTDTTPATNSGEASPRPDKTDKTSRFLTADQLRHIERLVAEVGADLGRLLAFFNVDSLTSLPATAYERVVRSLERRKTA